MQNQGAVEDLVRELAEVRSESSKNSDMLSRRTKQLSKVQSQTDSLNEFFSELDMDKDELVDFVTKNRTVADDSQKQKKAFDKMQLQLDAAQTQNKDYLAKFQSFEIDTKVNDVLNQSKIRPDRRDMAAEVIRKRFSFDEDGIVGDVEKISKELADSVPEWVESSAKQGFGTRPKSNGNQFNPNEGPVSALDYLDRGVKSGQLQTRGVAPSGSDNFLEP